MAGRVSRQLKGREITHLALPGETMELFETGAGDAALENAEILLCVDIERLLVDVGDEEVVALKVVGLIARRKIRLPRIHCDWLRCTVTRDP
jgi:hypothetical protein